MEDDLNFSWNKRHINSSGNWRQPLVFWKWKTTRVFRIWKTTKVFRKLKTTSLSANVKYFHWPMLILNSQSKTICNSINLKLAWPELSRIQPQLVRLLSPITHTGWLASTALPELGRALPQLVCAIVTSQNSCGWVRRVHHLVYLCTHGYPALGCG